MTRRLRPDRNPRRRTADRAEAATVMSGLLAVFLAARLPPWRPSAGWPLAASYAG